MNHELCRKLCPDYIRRIIKSHEHGYCMALHRIVSKIGECHINEIFEIGWKGIESDETQN